MLSPCPGQSSLHQPRRAVRDNDFVMQRDVVAVCVRDKREGLWLPGIEPQVLLRQINSALITNFDHIENLCANRRVTSDK